MLDIIFQKKFYKQMRLNEEQYNQDDTHIEEIKRIIAKRLKESITDIQIVGVDPIGSILGGGSDVTPYHVEGIGYDFFPDVLDNSLVDKYIKTNDEDSFIMARKLIQEEGLLIGGSCGAAVWGAIEAAKDLDENKNVLVILPDSIRNYLSKFVNDEWMKNNSFMV